MIYWTSRQYFNIKIYLFFEVACGKNKKYVYYIIYIFKEDKLDGF
jgi:hypothetical protein